MKKLAIFVEGQTEQIFVEQLLKEIAGRNNISIEVRSINGKQGNRITTVIASDPLISTTKFHVLVYNSGSDNNVVSDMRDMYNSLSASGYERIIGLRDVYPISMSDKVKLERGLRYSLPKGVIPIDVVLAVMEIEAWFLAEWNHFLKIDVRLTPENIQANFGFNPKIDDMEARHHPADDLHQIYKLVGRSYKKSRNQVNTIVSNLDYDFMYVELLNNVISFGEFIKLINLFISY
ncbi:DUF4276 family protein [Dolichospermum circinale]|uniref:DUF4276 family protein n=1 Tax=Dolichospermum circinale TaxID=109265 RepID=UPI00040A126E|nr:DUF4276 family protein [Dolichospermum circinale]MDB9484765.1 DUF4276 family protein [Dolichospermum circinale CS-537/05]MDB9453183.1 DUF4276 family protein [Dolichospermum circinale CS-541/06]MDB9463899.1 DUF4276 family protein [Dolichospermum circinale CS-541/04]MDB9476517.1 DUF4276 family protein [Dolichospermum circinale CS-537/11]MDB9480962.1 DUF4276 family protein [Dolichospermum circinale CS-537/03]